MKLFPSKNVTVEFKDDRTTLLNKLKSHTKLTNRLASALTDKDFIGQVDDSGFRIISSEIGRGAVCVFEGDFQDSIGVVEIRIQNVFKVLFSILMLMPIVGTGITMVKQGFNQSIGILVVMIMVLFFVRFIFMEMIFHFVSRTGFRKLNGIIGIKELS